MASITHRQSRLSVKPFDEGRSKSFCDVEHKKDREAKVFAEPTQDVVHGTGAAGGRSNSHEVNFVLRGKVQGRDAPTRVDAELS
jgi:hypothetical protein